MNETLSLANVLAKCLLFKLIKVLVFIMCAAVCVYIID